MRGALAFLRRTSTITKSVSLNTDGWTLIHVGLAAVRELEPDSWVKSFKKVNLHPHFRVSFAEWCKRISHFLQGGQTFKEESLKDVYALLPSFWHGMTPDEKKRGMSILQEHDSSYSVACIKALHSKLYVPLVEMQNLRVCLTHALKDPSHLERGVPELQPVQQPQAVADARAGLSDVTKGLVSFQLHPKKGRRHAALHWPREVRASHEDGAAIRARAHRAHPQRSS